MTGSGVTPQAATNPRSTVNWAAAYGVPWLATVAVYAPLVAIFHAPWLMAFVAAWGIVGVLAEARNEGTREIRQRATNRPKAIEVALAGVNALQAGTIWVLIDMGAYYLSKTIVRGLHGNPGSVAYIVAIVVGSFGAFGGTMVAVESAVKSLYPPTAGIKSGYYELARRGRWVIAVMGVSAGLVLLAVVALLAPVGRTDLLVMTLAALTGLFVVASTVEPRPHAPVQDRPRPATIAAAEAAFQLIDPRPVAFPRTRKDTIDPLLLDVDLLVLVPGGQKGFAVDIKQGPRDKPLEWTTCASLVTACRALASALEPQAVIHPLVILIDAQADDMFRRFARGEPLAVIDIDTRAKSTEVMDGDADVDLGAVAGRLLEALAPSTAATPAITSGLNLESA